MKRTRSELEHLESALEETVAKTDKLIAPVRESLFRRFPTISLLTVTFGVSATVYGIERLIADITWLNDRPFLILIIGISILTVMGRLYKKLG